MATYLQRLNPAATMPSLNIWEKFPVEDVQSGARRGVFEFNDFTDTVVSSSAITNWTNTGVGTDATVHTSAHGGTITVVTGGTQHNNEQYQHGGASYLTLTSCDMVAMETRCKLDDSGLAAFFFGLAVTDTTILASSALSTSDHVGLWTPGADDTIAGVVEAGDAARTVGALTDAELVDDTYVKLGLTVDEAGKVVYYINGAEVGTYDGSGNPTVVLRPSFAVAASTAAARTLTLDWIKVGVLFDD